MPVTREHAAAIAEDFLDREIRPKVDQEIVLTEVREFPTCWVAGYNTRAYLETGSVSHALAGGPIIINRRTGNARIGTSAVRAEDQLDEE
jgi:hypothetical protein